MRPTRVTLGLLLALVAGCEDPTLYVGMGHDEDSVRDASRRPVRKTPVDPDDTDLDAGAEEEQSEPDQPASEQPDDGEQAPATSPTTNPPRAPTSNAPVGPGGFTVPVPFLGDGGIMLGDAGIGLTGINLDWTTWPPRIRFMLSCRFDYDCAKVRQGVCIDSRCVQCRTASDCTQRGASCSAEHMCLPPPQQ